MTRTDLQHTKADADALALVNTSANRSRRNRIRASLDRWIAELTPVPDPVPEPTPVPDPVPVPTPEPPNPELITLPLTLPQWRHYAERGAGSVAVVNGVLRETVQSGGGYLEFYSKANDSYASPRGYTANYVTGGSLVGVNRLVFRVRSSQTVARPGDGSARFELGTYIRPRSNPDGSWAGAHYYHRLCPNLTAGRWVTVTINGVPQHQVSEGSGQPAIVPSYFDQLTRWYVDAIYGGTGNATLEFDAVRFLRVDGEPDPLVASVTATYTGTRYEVTWQTPPSSTQRYTVRFGDVAVSVLATGNTYTGVLAASPALPETSDLPITIQPDGQPLIARVIW